MLKGAEKPMATDSETAGDITERKRTTEEDIAALFQRTLADLQRAQSQSQSHGADVSAAQTNDMVFIDIIDIKKKKRS